MVSEWIAYIVLGLVGGFSEVLPVSATAHDYLIRLFFGLKDDGALVGMLIKLACMGAIFAQCSQRMVHIYRQLKIARLPARRRKRMADVSAVRDGRILTGALLPMLAVSLLCSFYADRFLRLLPMAGTLVLSGILVYIPQHFPAGNRQSRGMSRLDSLLLGLAAGVGCLPGMSSVGSMLCTGLLRGCDREYILEMILILVFSSLGVLVALDLFALAMAGFVGITLTLMLQGILAAAAAFAASYCAVSILRYLAVRVGFSGFGYYSFGLAMLSFILYLMT